MSCVLQTDIPVVILRGGDLRGVCLKLSQYLPRILTILAIMYHFLFASIVSLVHKHLINAVLGRVLGIQKDLWA